MLAKEINPALNYDESLQVKKECQHLLTINTHVGLFVHNASFWNFNSPVIMAESHGPGTSRASGCGLLY